MQNSISFRSSHWHVAKAFIIVLLTLILGLTSLSFTSPSYAASPSVKTSTSPHVLAVPLAPDPRYVVRKNYTSIVGTVPLREGYPTGFGYQHILHDHGVYPDGAITYILDYGRVTSQSGTRVVIEGNYPTDNRDYLILIDQQIIRQDGGIKGIITAYAKD